MSYNHLSFFSFMYSSYPSRWVAAHSKCVTTKLSASERVPTDFQLNARVRVRVCVFLRSNFFFSNRANPRPGSWQHKFSMLCVFMFFFLSRPVVNQWSSQWVANFPLLECWAQNQCESIMERITVGPYENLIYFYNRRQPQQFSSQPDTTFDWPIGWSSINLSTHC